MAIFITYSIIFDILCKVWYNINSPKIFFVKLGKSSELRGTRKGESIMHILVNAFSLGMLPLEAMNIIRVKRINSNEVPTDIESAIGHVDTAKVVSNILGFEVKPNRVSIKLSESDVLYVAQYTGPRLPEGATTLPEGASLEFFEVTFYKEGCRGCHRYDTGTCQNCVFSFWLSGAPIIER